MLLGTNEWYSSKTGIPTQLCKRYFFGILGYIREVTSYFTLVYLASIELLSYEHNFLHNMFEIIV
jgi:hypothetical protein